MHFFGMFSTLACFCSRYELHNAQRHYTTGYDLFGATSQGLRVYLQIYAIKQGI